ncbi:hypothetical protein HBI56_197480 [Parastagonospora nodorum]|nr:hypothetical protein HBH53_198520 [Parastagonospora nodorum]KAH4195436.1 hypothetical protein HBI95_193170 [Parastagonospora nodorum]KAH4913263.1 hypothetical protein HBH74_163220 [Parastagonospora nodorum]KAH4926986.1 hypothetical protein HBH73_204310 [Parastagonospora nodorum]KAH5068642.1 hypothetical protein HBH95_191800 [Parastagonospora nodorum]
MISNASLTWARGAPRPMPVMERDNRNVLQSWLVENAKCETSDSYPKSRRAAMRNKKGETREWKTNECLVVEGGRALTNSYSLYRDVPARSVAQNIQERVGSQEKRSRDEAGATGMSLGVTSFLSMTIMIK